MSIEGTILFVKYGSFSHTNQSVLGCLKREFPGCSIEVIDVGDVLPTRSPGVAVAATLEYLPSIVRGRKRPGECAMRTRYYFGHVRDRIRALATKDYLFSFQTQSIWDASLPGIPHFVYTDHTHLANLWYPDYREHQLYSRGWIELERSVYQAATMNFTMGTNIALSIVEQYGCPPEKVAAVGAGSNTDPASLGPSNRGKYESRNILFVGLDWERKGGQVLEAAFARVAAADPDARLTIVGSSPALRMPNCRVVGKVPLAEVAHFYEEAAVFCLPTLREPFGIVFLEAMEHALPVVATDLGAIPDFVTEGETGFLVPPRDVDALAGRLTKLISEPALCRRLGEAGRRQTMEKWNWEHTGHLLGEHIRGCL